MSAESADAPVGVGVVGLRPDLEEDPLADLAGAPGFRACAFCNEGIEDDDAEYGDVPCHSDFNLLLREPEVELVLVGGPLDRKRDFAVRALNAGCHVVLQQPFCETALDAERVMKTAFREGLVATMDMKWRDEADLRALRIALAEENVAPVHGVQAAWWPPEDQEEGATPPDGLLERMGLALLDQVNVLVREDVRDVSAHLLRPAPGRPETGFLLYLPLRNGGYALARAGRDAVEGLPRWVVTTRGATFSAADGAAAVLAAGERRVYRAPKEAQGFWRNLHDAIRTGAELKCHPRDIVRAMKLHEAALESAETGRRVTV